MAFFYLIALAAFGLVFGSFANVVIWRVPRGESIVSPGSRCPACGHPVRGYDNVPVLSWLVLRARCRDCSAPISARYPLVETLSGVLWLAAGIAFGPTPALAAAVPLFYLLMILAFVDLDTGRLPDPIVATLAGIGVACTAFSQVSGVPVAPLVGVAPTGAFGQPVFAALAGVLFGGGVSMALALVFERLRGSVGLGGGDIKLLGAMGLFLGPYVLLAMFAGSLLGTLAVPFMTSLRGLPLSKARIRFGPFLALGGVVAALAGPQLWGWYAGLL